MLKVEAKCVDKKPEIFQLHFDDFNPERGRSINQLLLTNRAGLKAVRDAIDKILESPEKTITTTEMQHRRQD